MRRKEDIEALTVYFNTNSTIAIPPFARALVIIIVMGLLFLIPLLTVVPWQQSTSGNGRVISLDPNQRIQDITTNVSGTITQWFIQDGERIKEGQPIVEISDVDPQFLVRLRAETEAKRRKYEVTKIAAETALKNFQRQEDLFKAGLSSRKTYEKAKITYKKLLSEQAFAESELAQGQVKLSREGVRTVFAPSDGTILRAIAGSGTLLVSKGEKIATFLPETNEMAVEVFIDGNDFPLIKPGRKARLQFEGFPAIQFIGWPSFSIGTFGGEVVAIDPSSESQGKFRVIIAPDKNVDQPWPGSNYLRQGTRVHAWVLLDIVKVGFELWRKFNGFPLAATISPDEKDFIYKRQLTK